MTTREDFKKHKENILESLSLSELVEKFVQENINYRNNLSNVSGEGADFVTDEYMRRTKKIREEIDRREQLYLEGHRTNIRY